MLIMRLPRRGNPDRRVCENIQTNVLQITLALRNTNTWTISQLLDRFSPHRSHAANDQRGSTKHGVGVGDGLINSN